MQYTFLPAQSLGTILLKRLEQSFVTYNWENYQPFFSVKFSALVLSNDGGSPIIFCSHPT